MFVQSLEFYVIAIIVAAAIIGLAARPQQRGEARTWLLPATLNAGSVSEIPAISISVDNHHNITLHRTGLPDETTSVNLSVTLIGRNISIEEHPVLSGNATTPGHVTAETLFSFTGPERYHLSYHTPALSLFTAMQFTVRPGVSIHKELTLS